MREHKMVRGDMVWAHCLHLRCQRILKLMESKSRRRKAPETTK